jgi:membrane-bound serine protease (ClpP class)
MSDILMVIAIIVLGLVLLAIEVFVLPGFGVVGVVGIAVILTGAGVAWVTLGASWGAGSLAIAFVVTAVALFLFPRTSAGKRLVLRADQGGARAADPSLLRLVGQRGRALTPLRPSGTVELADGERVDVVTDGVYVEPGRSVHVVKIEGVRVVVEEIEEGVS